jgi:putative PIG3 family NAD(P)H quinone oxidoreductase
MRAVVLDDYGDPSVLEIRDVPDPVPGPDEVVVEVAATALNRADLLQRLGLYPGPAMAHEIPGLEFSGRVVDTGNRVRGWVEGDAVMGIVGGGAYAERVAVHERQVLPVPSSIDLIDAAAIPEVWITAYDALQLQGGLTSGRTALVHAGASGVGTASIQLCKAISARVIVTASASKVAACRQLGADLAIDYGESDYVEAVKNFTHGAGVDVVVDVVGGDYVERNIDCLAVGGRIVQVGVMAGGASQVNVGKLLPKRASIVGTVLRGRPIEEKIAVTQRFGREVLPLFERGTLVPVIDRRYALDEIADAHVHMETNANVGKIVVVVADTV